MIVALIASVGCGSKKKAGDEMGSATAVATDGAGTLRASADIVLKKLVSFESQKDVTCWTSFRQLDWFIAEKSYSEFGTLAKIAAMKALVRSVWEKASAGAAGATVTAADVQKAVTLPKIELPAAATQQPFLNQIGVKNFTDYQKTSEHSRLVLSVIQTEMYGTGGHPTVKPLDESGVGALTDAATTLSLMMLKESGKIATDAKSTEIEGDHVVAAHKALATQLGLKNEAYKLDPLPPEQVAQQLQPITKQLIDNRVEALLKFNKASRNLTQDLNKVLRMPLTDDGAQAMLRNAQSWVHFVAAGYEPMQADNYLSDGSFAKSQMPRLSYIDEVRAQNVVMQLFPHRMMGNGDVRVRFEPNPGPATGQGLKPFEVTMRGDQMDGVRDSAVHWIAMQNVWNERAFAMDPFAAEYVSEVVSMMITLWSQRSEQIAAQMGKKAIDAEVVRRERQIDSKDFVMVPPVEPPSAAWTAERQKRKAELMATLTLPLFRDVSKTAGLPVKFATWNADLDSLPGHVGPEMPGHVEPMPGHVEPGKDTKGMPGHVEPSKDTKGMPGHVEPSKDTKGMPGHVEPDKDTKKMPGHVEPAKDTKGMTGHTEPAKDTKGMTGHVEPDKDTKKMPGHVEPQKDTKGMTGHTEPAKDTKGMTGHTEPAKDTKGMTGHTEPDTKKMPGHVEPAKDTKGMPGHVAPDDNKPFNLQTIMGGGIAVGDINGDDYPDLFLAGEELGKLYINQGKAGPGKFVDATAAWGLPADITDAHGVLFFDYDGDGKLDLLVLRSEHNSALFHQENGKFVDVADKVGLKTHRGAHVANVFDYDGDGDLDIYIGYYGSDQANMNPGVIRSVPSLDGRNGSPHQLWRNDGDHFTEVAKQAHVDDVGWTLAVGSFDADGDGKMDLFLANDFGADVFYKNNGDGTFTDITVPTGTGDRGSGMNVDVADINGDGKWDIYVTNIDMFSKNIKVIFPRDESTINIDDSLTKVFQYLPGNKLYVSTPTGYRPEENLRFEPKDRGWGWDAAFFDYENDGDDDLYITNGWINGSYAGNQKKQMYLNDGGFFYLAPEKSDEAYAGNARSAAPVDLDLDGKVDLVVNNFRQPPRVLMNNSKNANTYVQLRLVGKGKNPFAIGAQVSIKAGTKTILRQVSGGRGYLGQTDTLVSAGCADAKTVEVDVRWPDGTKTHHTLDTNKRHRIEQPK